MKTILYIDEKVHVRDNFSKLLGGQLTFFSVLGVENIGEAIEIIKKIRVDVVITGRQIGVKEVDLLDQCLRQHPHIKLIIMAEKKSQLAGMLKAFEYHIQFETPVDIPLLLETLLSEFNLHYGGQIRGISIASFLQMLELDDKTCLVKVLSGGKTGHLHFANGELIEARMDSQKGREAALAILEMENPLLTLDYDSPATKRTIQETLMSLLLKSGRIKDEKKKKPLERRRYKRFACSLPVDFVYNEWSYKAVISNISLSGVFIVTEDPFSLGEELDIAFYSHTLEKGCRISGLVARRAADGIGIHFNKMNINQIAILRTIINEVAGS